MKLQAEIFNGHWVDVEPSDCFTDDDSTLESIPDDELRELLPTKAWLYGNFAEPPKNIRERK